MSSHQKGKDRDVQTQCGTRSSSFSIFYCGCKQPKSIHIYFGAAKIRIYSYNGAYPPPFSIKIYLRGHERLFFITPVSGLEEQG